MRRQTIDAWPLRECGLGARAVTCLQHAGMQTVGQLRACSDSALLALPAFGPCSLDNVHWFLNWLKRLETGGALLPDLRSVLSEFLTPQQRQVIEQRYALTDPLFRPWMKRDTLREIGGERRGGITRERVRQIEEEALTRLCSHLARALMTPLRKPLSTAQRGNPVLGGYEPHGVSLLVQTLFERAPL